MNSNTVTTLDGDLVTSASRGERPSPTISVIVETFNAGFASDVSFEEALASLGSQDFPVDQVEYLMVTSSADDDMRSTLRDRLGDFKVATTLIEGDGAAYHSSKVLGMEHARGRVVAFADSDTILPPDWLRRIHSHLVEQQNVAVAGPTSFKPGSPLRTTLFLADFSLLSQDHLECAPHFNANNVAFQRDVLNAALAETPDCFERFGGSATIGRRLRDMGHRIELDREMRSVHGYDPKTFYFEKRMRRYAHAAFVVHHDPSAKIRDAGEMERPLSWLTMWRRYLEHYQSRPEACKATLGLRPAACRLQRVLLRCLSMWEYVLILGLAATPKGLKWMARKYEWWEE